MGTIRHKFYAWADLDMLHVSGGEKPLCSFTDCGLSPEAILVQQGKKKQQGHFYKLTCTFEADD